ncbi:MAG: Chloroplast import component protein (Tic20) [Eubacteriales bacterium]|jgi:uncharacterized membrane protein
MNQNGSESNRNQHDQQPFDYQEHYRRQNQQYRNPPPPYTQYPQDPWQQPPIPPKPPVRPGYNPYGMSADNTKVFCIMSYISILWLVGLLADRYNPKVRFHANQGIILTIFYAILRFVLILLTGFVNSIFVIPFSGVVLLSQIGAALNGLLTLLVWGIYLSFVIIGIMHAVHDREEPLPIIGTLFQILR